MFTPAIHPPSPASLMPQAWQDKRPGNLTNIDIVCVVCLVEYNEKSCRGLIKILNLPACADEEPTFTVAEGAPIFSRLTGDLFRMSNLDQVLSQPHSLPTSSIHGMF